MEAWSRMFPSRSGLASRNCFAVRPNSATFNRSASLAYVREWNTVAGKTAANPVGAPA